MKEDIYLILTMEINFSPVCMCHAKSESTMHYFLDCFLYAAERQTLFGLDEHHIQDFTRMNKTEKLHLLFNGFKTDDPDYNHLNLGDH